MSPEETLTKRRKITADILSISNTNSFSDQSNEQINDNVVVSNVLKSKLALLETQLEHKSKLHEIALQEKEEKIKKLIDELNEAKARAVHHKESYDKAQETLSTMKAKHTSVTGELRDSLESSRNKMIGLETKINHLENENESLKFNLQDQQASYTNNIKQLQNIIHNYEEASSESKRSLENLNRKYESLLSTIQDLPRQEEQDPAAIDSLLSQNLRLSKETNKLQSENERLSRELKHYKSIYQDVDMLRSEKASLEYKLTDYQELLTAKIALEYENSRLKAETATTAWMQSDAISIVRGKNYFESKMKQYESEVDMLRTVLKDMEDHLADLKKTIEEQKLVRMAETSARSLLVKRIEAAERHARMVENQLEIYDNAEKLYLDADKLDELKLTRIHELQALVADLEQQLLEQAKQMAEQQVDQAVQNKPDIQISNGPYLELTSGVQITEFLRDLLKKEREHFEELTQLNMDKTKLENKYKAAEALISELQKTVFFKSNLLAFQSNTDPIPEPTTPKLVVDAAAAAAAVEPVSEPAAVPEPVPQAPLPSQPMSEPASEAISDPISIDPTPNDEESSDQSTSHRILELIDNPASREYSIRRELLERLRQENKDLRQQILANASDLPPSTWTNLETENTKLAAECAGLKKRIKRMLTVYDAKIQKNMNLIKNLLGFHVIFNDESGQVRFESLWVEPSELHFRAKVDHEDHAILRIVGSQRDRYMMRLGDAYQTYMAHDRSIPAFLNAAALDLYVDFKEKQQDHEHQDREDEYMPIEEVEYDYEEEPYAEEQDDNESSMHEVIEDEDEMHDVVEDRTSEEEEEEGMHEVVVDDEEGMHEVVVDDEEEGMHDEIEEEIIEEYNVSEMTEDKEEPSFVVHLDDDDDDDTD